MPRTLPTGINANYTTDGSQPGYLLRIFLNGGTVLKVTSLDTDYSLLGDVYTSMDVVVPDMTYDGTVMPGAQVTFGDMDLILWTLAKQRAFDDAPIEIDVVYAAVADESTNVFIGTCNAPQRAVDPRGGATMSMGLLAKAGSQYAPRQRVQYVIDKKWMVLPGEIILINGQKWIIDRPKTSNS